MSFADLGISQPVMDALVKRGITATLSHPAAGHARCARGRRRARPVADRLGQDPGLRHPAGRPARARRPSASPPSSSRRRASWPARSSTSFRHRPRPRAEDRRRLRRRWASDRRRNAARRADIVVATPGRLEDLLGRGVAPASTSDPRPRRGRPDARHGLQAGGDRIVSRTPAERQTLFFSATLEGATGKPAPA